MPVNMKVCNVADYNDALKKRGRFFHHFDEAIQVWLEKDFLNKDKCKNVYSDRLIEVLAVLRYLFKYPFRQLEGALEDYIAHSNLTLPVPNFTTLCRRMAKLSLTVRDHRKKSQNKTDDIEVVIDSSGINIYHTGGGHSKENSQTRKHSWLDQVRKMHVAIDAVSKDVLEMKMTFGTTMDASVAPKLLNTIEENIGGVYADGAYDRKEVREACVRRGAKQIIPPPKNAIIRSSKKDEPPELWNERNAAIELIQRYEDIEEGRAAWKKEKEYGTRSVVEAYFSRFKTIFGFHFMCRKEKAREIELIVKTRMMNEFNQLGAAIFKRTT